MLPLWGFSVHLASASKQKNGAARLRFVSMPSGLIYSPEAAFGALLFE
jgi:hypothetical protein